MQPGCSPACAGCAPEGVGSRRPPAQWRWAGCRALQGSGDGCEWRALAMRLPSMQETSDEMLVCCMSGGAQGCKGCRAHAFEARECGHAILSAMAGRPAALWLQATGVGACTEPASKPGERYPQHAAELTGGQRDEAVCLMDRHKGFQVCRGQTCFKHPLSTVPFVYTLAAGRLHASAAGHGGLVQSHFCGFYSEHWVPLLARGLPQMPFLVRRALKGAMVAAHT